MMQDIQYNLLLALLGTVLELCTALHLSHFDLRPMLWNCYYNVILEVQITFSPPHTFTTYIGACTAPHLPSQGPNHYCPSQSLQLCSLTARVLLVHELKEYRGFTQIFQQ